MEDDYDPTLATRYALAKGGEPGGQMYLNGWFVNLLNRNKLDR